MDIKNCSAYELKDKQELTELNSTGYLLEHEGKACPYGK